MLTKDQALQLVAQKLRDMSPPDNVFLVVDAHTVQRPFGWVFFYTSKKFLETGLSRYQLAGNGPVVVNKHDASVEFLGTAADVLAEYDAGVCDECGAPTEVRREGSCQGAYCTCCSWSVVTTYIPEIVADTTLYEVRVRDGDYRNLQHIKAVAKVSNTNFLTARRLLQEAEPLVFSGWATDVVRVRETIVGAEMLCPIKPTFRW